MKTVYFALCLVLLCGCSSRPHDVQQSESLPEIFPDYVGVTIPPDIAPLDFAMADDAYTTVDVDVKGSHGGTLHTNGSYADFDAGEWQQLLTANRGGELTLTVRAARDGQWTEYRPFTIRVSREPMGEWGITYRRVAPGYALFGRMGIYQRELASFDEQPILETTMIPGQCVNCHTANRTNPDQRVMHVRGIHGATVIHREGRDEILKAKNELLGGSMVYPYWHPGGRYCAFSTNKTGQKFHTGDSRRIDVYDSASDVFVYDAETQTVMSDSLTMKADWAENCPAFSPDGKWLYFVTARRSASDGEPKLMYSLCRTAFDERTGHLGAVADTLLNTLTTGKSVSWPRPSYDGRYLMYTQADYGYFMVWHPEADLWLMDLETGQTRPMTEVNSDRAESLHNWSANSQWFLFTSRRIDGLYTRIYFSSIDSQGRATKPFLLPQRDPKHYDRSLLYSFNTPDFTSRPVDADARALARRLEASERIEPTFK